jgi:hypothetical protein
MGNRAILAFGTWCEFEANNCVPVTWLALFESGEFLIERRVEELAPRTQKPAEKSQPGAFHKLLALLRSATGRVPPQTGIDEMQSRADREIEEYSVAMYRTSRLQAIRRVESAIGKLKGQTAIWAFLRPLEILRDELHRCPQETIELDLTQFWAIDKVFEQRVSQAPDDFAGLLDALTNDEEQDLAALNQLVNSWNRVQISSVTDLAPEVRMFVLLGTFYGDKEREAIYSLEHFSEAYWSSADAG